MIENIKQLMELGTANVVLFILILLLSITSFIQLIDGLLKGVDSFCRRFGLKTKWSTKEEKQNALIREHECRFQNIDESLKKLQEQREQDVKDSKAHDKKIEDDVNNIADILLDEQIDTKRNRILNFANALQNGKHQDKEQYDFIFIQYDKYEKILKVHNLENGQVTASMEFIRQTYQEKLKNGF